MEGYEPLPNYTELVMRVKVLEKMLDDKRGGGMTDEMKDLEDTLMGLEIAFDNLKYNAKKNFDELNDTLIEQNILSPHRTPNYNWKRKVRI